MTHAEFATALIALKNIADAEHPRILTLSLSLSDEKRAALHRDLVTLNGTPPPTEAQKAEALAAMEKLIVEAEHKITTAERALRRGDESKAQQDELTSAEAALNALSA